MAKIMKPTMFFPALKHFNIPNVITTLGLVFGIFAAFFLTQRNLRMAIILLAFSALMDFVDGFVATKLKQQTEFGQYLDTLVDFFTCCIMPIWMVFDLLDNNPIMIGALVLYCASGLWRLAYYNIIEAKGHFTGMPVPGAMMIVTMAIWCVVMYNVPVLVAAATFFVTGVLMVSGLRLQKYGIWQKIFGLIGLAFFVVVAVS